MAFSPPPHPRFWIMMFVLVAAFALLAGRPVLPAEIGPDRIVLDVTNRDDLFAVAGYTDVELRQTFSFLALVPEPLHATADAECAVAALRGGWYPPGSRVFAFAIQPGGAYLCLADPLPPEYPALICGRAGLTVVKWAAPRLVCGRARPI